MSGFWQRLSNVRSRRSARCIAKQAVYVGSSRVWPRFDRRLRRVERHAVRDALRKQPDLF